MIVIPLGLRTALESGQCVLFLGAGIGAHLKDNEGVKSPDAETLTREIGDYFSINVENDIKLPEISEIVEIRKGRQDLIAFLSKRFKDLEPDETFKWLFTLRWKAIYTTNYDFGIERAYDMISNPPLIPKTISLSHEFIPYDPQSEVPIYHLHGCLYGTVDPKIIITENDYINYRERRRMLFEQLKNHCATSPFLYLGYSNKDPNWKIIHNEITSEFFPSKLPHSYRVVPTRNEIDEEILKTKNHCCPV